ncbi:hypothetical protein BaRGS_00009141 [Batillaria attramentaria]|uniref:Sulfotransferase n=1 Tax=Batillaria attramentaria TaxID=370345 RepID=A0ABD0LIY0_9CAEN
MRVSLKWVAIGLTALLVVMLIHKQFGDSRDDRDSGRRSKAKKEKNGKEKKTKEEKEEKDKGDAGSTDADEAEKLNRYGHKPRMKRNEQLKRLEETGAVRWDVRMLKVAGSGKNAKLRCLPFFYVAGVAKCGTTDFYRRLRYHPDIMWGELKEYHWWDRLRYGSSMELKFLEEEGVKNEEPMPLSKYSEIITGDEIEDVARELKKDGFSELICGDGSPSYLWDNSQWVDFVGNEGCTEPRIVAGSFIKDAYPDSRIFLLFRQPTQRVYSRFLSRIPRVPAFKNATPAMFHDYVVKGVQIYKDCFKRASIRECAYNEDVYDEAVSWMDIKLSADSSRSQMCRHSTIRLNEGLYSVYVEDWLRIFKREQIMVIRNEDYSENVEGTMISAFIWLGMAPLTVTDNNHDGLLLFTTAPLTDAQLKPIVEHVSVNTGQNYGVVGPMLPETIEILNEFYAPFNARLAELLEDDRFLWKDIIVT